MTILISLTIAPEASVLSAIKLVREATGLRLREARDICVAALIALNSVGQAIDYAGITAQVLEIEAPKAVDFDVSKGSPRS